METFIELKNSKENNLGLPLPKGVLRVYKADTRGGQQLIGEDQIDHTPKDETVRVKLGNAFDIVAERNQTDFQVISDRVFEMGFSVTIRNHKDQPIIVWSTNRSAATGVCCNRVLSTKRPQLSRLASKFRLRGTAKPS